MSASAPPFRACKGRPGCLGPRVPGSEYCRACSSAISLQRARSSPHRPRESRQLVSLATRVVAAEVRRGGLAEIARVAIPVRTYAERVGFPAFPARPAVTLEPRPEPAAQAAVGVLRREIAVPPAGSVSMHVAILIATALVQDAAIADEPITRERIAVAAWKLWPGVFGLVGYRDLYPNASLVLSKLCSTGPLIRDGYIEHPATNEYRVTRRGMAAARRGAL